MPWLWAGWAEPVDLDALLDYYFGGDPDALGAAAREQAKGKLAMDFGVEQESGRKFALWTLMEALGFAPFPAEAFPKHPRLREAADAYLTAAYRLERDSGE